MVRGLSMTKPVICKICLSEMKVGAKKCLICNSYQDWRRYFNNSVMILSLLIALISVITTGGPIIKSLFVQDRSAVHFSILNCENDKIQIVSSNLGNRAGILKGVTLNILSNDTEKKSVVLTWGNENPVVKPGYLKVFELRRLSSGIPIDFLLASNSTDQIRYELDFEVISFSQKPEITKIKFSF